MFPPAFVPTGRLPDDLDDSILDLEPRGPAPVSDTSPVDLSDAHASRAQLSCRLPPGSTLLAALRGPYRPVACGPWPTRQAIAAWLTGVGRPTVADDLVLTASTSEALSFLFKWRCRPGDAVAHMQPGYPLLAHLAAAEGLVPVPLASHFRDGRWHLDVEALGRILARGCRCVVLTSPNNPTGACLSDIEAQAVAALCNQAGALCIVDEVFAPYRLQAIPWGRCALPGANAVVSLGGMSKAALLPQLKISWLAIEGAPAFRRQARIAMTWLTDLYLNVSAPSAAAAETLVAQLPLLHHKMTTRLARNAQWLAAQLTRHQLGSLHIPDGGFVAPLRFSDSVCQTFAIGANGHGAQALQRAANVRWQSGDLYDLPPQWHAVVSLLPPPTPFMAAWRRVMRAAVRR